MLLACLLGKISLALLPSGAKAHKWLWAECWQDSWARRMCFPFKSGQLRGCWQYSSDSAGSASVSPFSPWHTPSSQCIKFRMVCGRFWRGGGCLLASVYVLSLESCLAKLLSLSWVEKCMTLKLGLGNITTMKQLTHFLALRLLCA